jgi:hypothetical protein
MRVVVLVLFVLLPLVDTAFITRFFRCIPNAKSAFASQHRSVQRPPNGRSPLRAMCELPAVTHPASTQYAAAGQGLHFPGTSLPQKRASALKQQMSPTRTSRPLMVPAHAQNAPFAALRAAPHFPLDLHLPQSCSESCTAARPSPYRNGCAALSHRYSICLHLTMLTHAAAANCPRCFMHPSCPRYRCATISGRNARRCGIVNHRPRHQHCSL